MIIQNSNLLTTKNKAIQVLQGCFVANDGPNIIGKLNLNTLNVKYDSVFVSKMTLESEGKDKPIMYGWLGTNTVFIMIVPNYGGINPQVCTSKDLYLEYFYEDEPLVRRTLTDILVLTGNADHRIPQIYLYNPTGDVVFVDIMVANLDVNEISANIVPEFTEISGLLYNDVISDQMFGLACTGSTQFEILNYTGQTQMVIPYYNIDIIQYNDTQLLITTNSEKSVKLNFISRFNALQAYSRMNYVMESSANRYLTKAYPGLDTTGPAITFKTITDPTVMTLGSGIYKPDIIFRFLDSIVDNDNAGLLRDGIINVNNADVLLMNSITAQHLSAITSDGFYSATFTVIDVAGNSTSSTKQILVDSLPPTIYYTTGKTINVMDLTGDTQTPGTILKDDLRRYYLNYVWDNVDGIIPNSGVSLSIISGVTNYSAITSVGFYNTTFYVNDRAGNITTGYTLLHVVESVPPVIIYNSVFTGSAFTMSMSGSTGLTNSDIVNYAISAVTDNYDGIIPLTSVGVSGTTIPILIVDNYNVTFSVSDSSGNITTDTKYLIVTT